MFLRFLDDFFPFSYRENVGKETGQKNEVEEKNKMYQVFDIFVELTFGDPFSPWSPRKPAVHKARPYKKLQPFL